MTDHEARDEYFRVVATAGESPDKRFLDWLAGKTGTTVRVLNHDWELYCEEAGIDDPW